MIGHVSLVHTREGKEKVLFSQENMIVDSAAEHIVNYMTRPSSPSAVSANTTALVDTSNFGIAAFSLGSAKKDYEWRHGKFYPSSVVAGFHPSGYYPTISAPILTEYGSGLSAIRNGNFSERMSVLENPNFEEILDIDPVVVNQAEGRDLGLLEIDGWTRFSPLDNSLNPGDDLALSGRVFVATSSNSLGSDTPSGNMIGLYASAINNNLKAGAYIETEFVVPSSIYSKSNVEVGDIDQDPLFNLSFWMYSVSSNSSGLNISLTDTATTDRYQFETKLDGDLLKGDWGAGVSLSAGVSSSPSDGWQFISTSIRPRASLTDRTYKLRIQADGVLNDYALYYIRGVTLWNLPGWEYGHHNYSSTTKLVTDSETSGYYLDLNWSSLAISEYKTQNKIVQRFTGLDPLKNYFVNIVYKTPNAGAALKCSLSKKVGEGDFSNYDQAGEPGASALQWTTAPSKAYSPLSMPSDWDYSPSERCIHLSGTVLPHNVFASLAVPPRLKATVDSNRSLDGNESELYTISFDIFKERPSLIAETSGVYLGVSANNLYLTDANPSLGWVGRLFRYRWVHDDWKYADLPFGTAFYGSLQEMMANTEGYYHKINIPSYNTWHTVTKTIPSPPKGYHDLWDYARQPLDVSIYSDQSSRVSIRNFSFVGAAPRDWNGKILVGGGTYKSVYQGGNLFPGWEKANVLYYDFTQSNAALSGNWVSAVDVPTVADPSPAAESFHTLPNTAGSWSSINIGPIYNADSKGLTKDTSYDFKLEEHIDGHTQIKEISLHDTALAVYQGPELVEDRSKITSELFASSLTFDWSEGWSVKTPSVGATANYVRVTPSGDGLMLSSISAASYTTPDTYLVYTVDASTLNYSPDEVIGVSFQYDLSRNKKLSLAITALDKSTGEEFMWDGAYWEPIGLTDSASETIIWKSSDTATDSAYPYTTYSSSSVLPFNRENVRYRFSLRRRAYNSWGGIYTFISNFRVHKIKARSKIKFLPEFPTPFDKSLQSIGASGTPQRMGHFLNFLEFSGSYDVSSSLDDVLEHGCYLPGPGLVMASSTFGAPSVNDFSGTLIGTLNKHSVINSEGFILENDNSRPVQSVLDAVHGFVVSGASDASATRTLTYALTLSSGDWKFLDWYYGGLESIGLWTFDVEESHKKLGAVPFLDRSTGTPYSTSLYNLTDVSKNPKFRLFAKKVFFPGGLQIPELHNNDYLTIYWEIQF